MPSSNPCRRYVHVVHRCMCGENALRHKVKKNEVWRVKGWYLVPTHGLCTWHTDMDLCAPHTHYTISENIQACNVHAHEAEEGRSLVSYKIYAEPGVGDARL